MVHFSSRIGSSMANWARPTQPSQVRRAQPDEARMTVSDLAASAREDKKVEVITEQMALLQRIRERVDPDRVAALLRPPQ